MTYCKVERLIGKRTLSIEFGKIAKQADGAALVQYGETVVLARQFQPPTKVKLQIFSRSPLIIEKRLTLLENSQVVSSNEKADPPSKKY